jgi:hypothetical protein
MDRFYDLSEDTVQIFNQVLGNKVMPVTFKFKFVGDSKQKRLIKISKFTDDVRFAFNVDMKVVINEALLESYDEESITILIEQEVDRIQYSLEKDQLKLVKPDLNTFSSLINKYGIESIARANKVEELYQQQLNDGKSTTLTF